VAVLVLTALWLMSSGPAFAETFNVTTSLDTNDGSCDSDCSLREAIIAANQHLGADTVVVPAGTYVLSLVGSEEDQSASGDLDIVDDLTILGAGRDSTQIDGNGTDRVFDIHGAVVVVLSGLSIQNGRVGDGGGGIANAGTLTLTDCTLSDNAATATGGDGGGIYNSGAATLTNCNLRFNRAGDIVEFATGSGGGIYNTSVGTLTLTHCGLEGNSGYAGAGIYNAGAATLTNCSVVVGRFALYGSGIYNRGTLTLRNCDVSGNSAVASGGGIYNTGPLTLTNCTVSGNSVLRGSYGGGIYNAGGTATLTDCWVSDNSVQGFGGSPVYGGGILNGGTMTLTNCTISRNRGDIGRGGGIYNGGMLTLANCTLSHNVAGGFGSLANGSGSGYGGGIYNGYKVALTNCTLSGNEAGDLIYRASGYGGAIANERNGEVTLANCTLSDNAAVGTAGTGGGIWNFGTATLGNTIITNSPGGSCSPGAHPVQSTGHNLDEDGSCGLLHTGDLSMVPAYLTPLGAYGGPTQTQALCTGPGVPDPACAAASPAIDVGDNADCPDTDQRGAPRPQGSACDIGAYESDERPPDPTATPTPTLTPTATSTATPTQT